ncbi:MAG TPA: ISAs1 family transposase [Streptosporangiaceae bacterium]|nr:ISAs1 family transposase [Streptosporangiaceae bacterium]
MPGGERALLAGERPGLAVCLASVPDPRDPRGVRHSLTPLLLAAVAAVLAGARSFTAIGEWVADAPPQVLASLGIRRDPLGGRFVPPDEAPIRRVLEAVDAEALDAAVGSWLTGQLRAAVSVRTGPGRRALAVDGKTVRGTRPASRDGQGVHLLAAADQQVGAVLAQAKVDGKTNEITCFAPLLEPLDLAGQVITADALHTQHEHAKFLVSQKEADYILVVKNNQPSLYAQIKNLPWRQVPVAHDARELGHGRGEWRTLKLTAVAKGLPFPHAAQAIRITRRRRPLTSTISTRWATETSYAITSLAASQATPAQLAAWIRGHWAIEALHHIRDVSYGEDASQVRTGNGPQVMATLRNLTTGIMKMAGHRNIAAACRHYARDATRTLAALGLSPA